MTETQTVSPAMRGGRLYPCCRQCGSASVMRDAWAVWDDTIQRWTLGAVFDAARCDGCDKETSLIMQATGTPQERVRALNDGLRRGLIGEGRVLITAGLKARGDRFLERVLAAVRGYDFAAYDAENPDGLHDFAAFSVDGSRIFFKIDYYDQSLTGHSPDPADAAVTERVLTVMLAEEY